MRATPSETAMKTLVSLLVVLSCGLRPVFAATNDAPVTPGGTLMALSGCKSASQSPLGGVTTTIRETVSFEHAIKGLGTNSLNASSNDKLLAAGQHLAPTNSVSPVEQTVSGPVDVTANQRQKYSSDQDKYGGILYNAYRADNPLQLINPFAPREDGQSDTADLTRDPVSDVPSGFSLFSIRIQ